MKRWRVYFRNTLGIPSPSDSFIEIEGDLVVNAGVLTFWTECKSPDWLQSECFRVIREYSDCFAINADGEPLRPA